MYAIGNVEKFLEDNASQIGSEERQTILERARKQAEPDGVLMSGMADEVWQNEELYQQFMNALGSDAEHMEIGATTIRRTH